MGGVRRFLGFYCPLAYAITHPERVDSLIPARGVFLLTKRAALVLSGRRLDDLPRHGERFVAPHPEAGRGDLMAAYTNASPVTRPESATVAPSPGQSWEGETVSVEGPAAKPDNSR
jgi:proline iminopeptidase